MKLYELKRGDKFRLLEDTKAPPDIGFYEEGMEFTLHNIDGMYSYCTDVGGHRHHPAAWSKVEKIND